MTQTLSEIRLVVSKGLIVKVRSLYSDLWSGYDDREMTQVLSRSGWSSLKGSPQAHLHVVRMLRIMSVT